MGTRHLVAVQIDGEYKVAQYGQWDGYPSGKGIVVLDFLDTIMADVASLELFKSNLRQTRWVTEEESEAAWVDAGAEPGAKYVSMDVVERHNQKYPQLSRNTGAKILDAVLALPAPLALQNNIDFAKNSLFCEWAYVIDFDSNTFEVFKGFNMAPTSGRFAGQVQIGRNGPGSDGYGPVALVASWPLDHLPDATEFLNTLVPPDEDEDEGESEDK